MIWQPSLTFLISMATLHQTIYAFDQGVTKALKPVENFQGLASKLRRVPNLKNRVPENVEEAYYFHNMFCEDDKCAEKTHLLLIQAERQLSPFPIIHCGCFLWDL